MRPVARRGPQFSVLRPRPVDPVCLEGGTRKLVIHLVGSGRHKAMTRRPYVPILKGKAGELAALKDVQPATWDVMSPLVEVVPPSDEPDAAAMEKACGKLVGTVFAAYQGVPVMLDAGLLDLSVPLAGGRSAVGLLADEARENHVVALPVLRLDDPPLAIRDAAAAHARDDAGVVVRLLSDDLDEDPEDVEKQLNDILDHMGLSPESTDLLLDLGAVEGDIAVRGGARMAVSLLRELDSLDQWRTVIVAAGAFPVDLSQFSAWKLGEQARFDAQVFDRVTRRPPREDIRYADYAITHPLLSSGPQFAPPPQLRYTTAERWLVLKGSKRDPRGNSQFQEICLEVAAHPDFTGAALGKADQRIAAGSPEGPGNGATWRAVGTTHHLDLVAARFTNLGEP